LALDEFVFERGQVRVIELKLQLEGPIRQAAPLAQQRDHLIHHRDKVHPISPLRLRRQRAPSLTGALPCQVLGLHTYARVHHSISDRERVEASAAWSPSGMDSATSRQPEIPH